MFSEKIDIATNGIKAYAKDLKDITKKICKAIAEIGDCDNVDVEYYTDSEIANYTFYDCDTDGYGVGIYIGGIERLSDDPIFDMKTDGGAFCERDIDDFTESELIWLAEMMNDLYNVVSDDGKVEEMPKRRVRW